MADIIPITLTKDNLGQRHKQLNTFVKEAYDALLPFESIEHLPEQSPVDRLFKIDLASKLRNVDYILQNIKDEDTLYVSRALKCTWLLDTEYQNIICPKYLEDVLYPDMVTTAISRMKNWLYIHLNDPERCEIFYSYYQQNNFNYAIKFLSHCNKNFILNETPSILDRLSPQYFKRLCEVCPSVAKIYFDSLPENDKIKSEVIKYHLAYYNSLKVVLKLAPDIFFNIAEKYFNVKYGPSMTKYILKNHKDKFDGKVELYSSSLLDIETMAKCLSPEECKEVVLKLARAKYLSAWFSYKNVEPFIKRLKVEERTAFKKRVFVAKDIGKMVDEWPYNIPVLPSTDFDNHIFDDPKPISFDCMDYEICCRSGRFVKCAYFRAGRGGKTLLDKLFDEFRFVTFGQAFFELRRRIRVESSLMNREYILLVLISKSGGQPENIATLFELLAQHLNEPVHFRAAIVRSLMKRAAVWRLPQNTWEEFLEFGRGLGLDGKTSEVECSEGLHAVVLRSLLRTGNCESLVRDAFLREFSNFKEYSINTEEKRLLSDRLPTLILSAVESETNVEVRVKHLNLLLDTLQSYNIKVETSPLIPAVQTLAKSDMSASQSLLRQLFDLKIARRTLFYENFEFIQNDASYMNALRHDISVLNVNKFVDLAEKGEHRMDQFLRKMTIYFSERFGLLDYYLIEIRKRVFEKPDVKLAIARPLCILQGADLPFIRAINPNTKYRARLSAAVHANMHAGRLKLDMTKMGLSAIGAKGCANKVLVCPRTQVNHYVTDLLKWKRTVRIAIVLAERIGQEADVFATAVNLRPLSTLKAAIKYFQRKGDNYDPRVWEVIKSTLQNLDYSSDQRCHLRNFISKVDKIPQKIKPEYCTILFVAFKENFNHKAITMLNSIETFVPHITEDFMNKILLEFLNKFDIAKVDVSGMSINLYFRIIVKYLLFSNTESIRKTRLEVIGEPFLNCLEKLLKSKSDFIEHFEKILRCLQANEVFFNDDYVSPLPVLEKIVSWMHLHLPVEIHFEKYVYVHLTMLYFRAVRLSILDKRNIFADKKLKMTDGVDVVGQVFGKFIIRDVKELMLRYFESVIEIYKGHLAKYFDEYFEYGESKNKFIVAVLKGMLESSDGAESKLAVYLLDKYSYRVDKTSRTEIVEKLKKIENAEVKFIVFAKLCN